MTIQATGPRAGTGDDGPQEPVPTATPARPSAPTGGPDQTRRPPAIRVRDRLVASDPGHVRLALASRAAVALALSLAVSAALASVLGLAGTQAIIVLVLGAVLTMITTFTAADPTPLGRAVTQVSLPLAMLAGITLSTLVDRHRLLSLSMFVVVMFVVVWIRRFGPRAFACGMVAWMGYFIALFLQLSFAQLPTVLLAVATTTVLLLLVALVVAPQRPALRLRRMVDSFAARTRIALAEHRDPALRPAWRRADETARDRAVLRVNEAAVLVDGQLAIPGAVADPARAAEVRAAVIRVEAALARAMDQDGPGADDAVTDALADLRTVLDDDRLRRPRRGDEAGEAAPFTPATDLFAGFLPGSAATVGPMVAPDDEAVRGSGRTGGMLLSTRQACQIALAGALAIALGDALSGQRWYWAVLACFLAFTGTATAAETVRKAAQRTVGTLVGVVVALVVVPWLGHSTAVSLTVILVAIFVGFYLFRVSYTSLAFAVTVIVAELYELLGTYSGGLLALRVEETALGAVIGGVVAVSFLPITAVRAERAARARLAEELRAATTDVAAVVAGTATGVDLHARARALDAAVHQLALIGVPLSLRFAPGGARRRPTIARRLAGWVRCAVRVRALVEAARQFERTRRSDPAVRHERVGAATRAVQGLVDALVEGRDPGEHRHRRWEDTPDDLLTELSALHGALVALHGIDPDAAPVVGNAGLCGRVTDERGTGVPAVVTVVDPDGTQRGRVHAASDGAFTVDLPDDGWRQLVVAADGYAPYAGRIGGGTHDVVLRPSGAVRR